MEVIDSVLFNQLFMDFEARLEKIFKQLELFRFPVGRGRSASIVAGVFSLWNCGWLVERFFFSFPEGVLWEQYVTSSWTPVIMSWGLRICSVAPVTMLWRSSGPEFCAIWLLKMPASGWGLLWASSSFVLWLGLNTFRKVCGAVPEWRWINGFMRKSSRRASASSMRFSVLRNSCDKFLVTLLSISSKTWDT